MTQDPAASKKPASAPGTPPTAPASRSGGPAPAVSPGGKSAEDGKRAKGAKRSAGRTEKDPLRRSRAGGFYLGIIALGIVLVLLIIFLVQNTDPATVRFLGFEGETPLAVALLISASAGLFLAGIAASLRIFQLRRRVKSDRKA